MTNLYPSGILSKYRLAENRDIFTLDRAAGSDVAAFSTKGTAFEDIQLTEEEYRGGTSLIDHRSELAEEALPTRPDLRVCFFGLFKINCEDKTLPSCRNIKALAILKYMLSHRDRPVSRDYLMCWMWPEANLKKASWSLNSAIYALRRFLGDHLPIKHASRFVVCDGGHYHLCPTLRLQSDVEEYDRLYRRGCRLAASGKTFDAVAEYKRAIKLYRGDYLCEDLYEDWTMIERERLASNYVYMLDQLADHYLEIGHHQRAVEVSYKILEKDPGYEENHRRLISCYGQLGLRELALKHYQLCRRVLKGKYGIDPSEDTHAAYRRILGSEIDT